MTKHNYPWDLYAKLQRRWHGEPLAAGWSRVDLPQKEVLDEFLDVCYHSSLMTEEGRPTIFRVAFISRRTPVSPPRPKPVTLEPIMRYALSQPVPFTVGELRRLAPVADPRRILIAVEQIGEGTRRRLQIYGLIDVGMALWEMARHERISGPTSPEALVVTSTRPGEARATGDEMGAIYQDSLPNDFKSRFPSLLDIYNQLSSAMHEAKAEAALFEDCARKIAEHFDACRVFRL